MGLGLYISRQIVELHGGELLVEFPEDGGSRFVVRLPDGARGHRRPSHFSIPRNERPPRALTSAGAA